MCMKSRLQTIGCWLWQQNHFAHVLIMWLTDNAELLRVDTCRSQLVLACCAARGQFSCMCATKHKNCQWKQVLNSSLRCLHACVFNHMKAQMNNCLADSQWQRQSVVCFVSMFCGVDFVFRQFKWSSPLARFERAVITRHTQTSSTFQHSGACDLLLVWLPQTNQKRHFPLVTCQNSVIDGWTTVESTHRALTVQIVNRCMLASKNVILWLVLLALALHSAWPSFTWLRSLVCTHGSQNARRGPRLLQTSADPKICHCPHCHSNRCSNQAQTTNASCFHKCHHCEDFWSACCQSEWIWKRFVFLWVTARHSWTWWQLVMLSLRAGIVELKTGDLLCRQNPQKVFWDSMFPALNLLVRQRSFWKQPTQNDHACHKLTPAICAIGAKHIAFTVWNVSPPEAAKKQERRANATQSTTKWHQEVQCPNLPTIGYA